MTTVQRVRLLSHHHASRTKHTNYDERGAAPFPAFVELAIAAYHGQPGYYLLHICADGRGTDTWHESIEDAIHQAEWEFGVKPEDGHELHHHEHAIADHPPATATCLGFTPAYISTDAGTSLAVAPEQ